MLAQAIMRTIEEKVGSEAWEAMSAEERNKKYKVYRGDCWQHLRNIMIDAMAKTGNDYVKDIPAVSDSLEEFSKFERIEVEGASVIRAAFKQFHHGGEYAKVSMHAWLLSLSRSHSLGGSSSHAWRGLACCRSITSP